MRKGIMMYELCLVVKPDCAEAHNNLGVLYRSMGNMEKAFNCYLSALQINPRFHQALSNVAVIYTSQVTHDLITACFIHIPSISDLGMDFNFATQCRMIRIVYCQLKKQGSATPE